MKEHLFSKGGKYEGPIKNGKLHGTGTLTFPDGRKYVGDFSHDKPNGYGILETPEGTKYEGKWRDGVLTDYVICSFVNGIRRLSPTPVETQLSGFGTSMGFHPHRLAVQTRRIHSPGQISQFYPLGLIMTCRVPF